MRYNLDSTLPINAFSPRAKGPFNRGMTLEGGGDSWNPVNIVSDAVSSVSDALAQIDPGPAIGNVGAQLDKAVNDVIPGGWAMVGAIALTVATWGSVDLEPEVLAGEAGAEVAPVAGAGGSAGMTAAEAAVGEGAVGEGAAAVGEGAVGEGAAGTGGGFGLTASSGGASASGGGFGLTAGSGGVTSSGVAGLGGAMGTGLTYGGVGAGVITPLQAALTAAGTGALYGGGIGGAKALITGQDPLKGALMGALYGGLTGGLTSGIGSALSGLDLTSTALNPYLAKALTSISLGAAQGQDIATLLQNSALNTGLSALGNNTIPSDINPAITAAGTGAVKAAITGSDPITGALMGAGSSLVGQGIGAGKELYGNLTAPSASAEPINPATGQPVSEGSGLTGNGGLINLAGVGEMSPELTGKYLTEAATTTANKVSELLPTISEQKAALLDQANTVKSNNDAYTAAQNALKSGIDAQYGPMYKDVLGLQSTAQDLFGQITDIQKTYDTNKATYEASGNTDRAAYDAANSAAVQLNAIIPQYNTASQDFTTANTKLTDLYNSDIAPLVTTLETAKSTLDGNVSTFSTAQTALGKIVDTAASYITGLNDISNGKLPTDYKAAELAMSAPTAQGFTNEELAAIQKGQEDAVAAANTGSQTAANVTVEGAPSTMTDVGGGATTPYVPTQNPETPNYPTGTTVNGDGSTTVKNADGSIDNYDANGDLVSSTPAPDNTGVSPTDIIANLPTDTNGTATGGGLPSTTDTGTTPTSGGTAPTDGGLPSTTGTTDLANLPVAPPATGGGTAPTGGGLPSTTDTGTTPTSGGTTAGTGTGTTAGTGTGTTAGTGTGTTAGTGTGTMAGTGTGTTAGLTTAGLAAALAALGYGSSSNASSGSTTTTPTAPKGTFVHGKQITSPLSSFNVPTINYATPATNPNSLKEIQNAATGGIMHLATGGSSEDDLSLKPVLMRGKQAQHANLFGLGGIPLYPIPGKAEGGSIPQGFNPQFYSEGGLGTMQNKYVQGPGTGTSDSIPAMLSNGEFVIPANVVSALGNGSNDNGAKVLDSFLKAIKSQKQKHDSKHRSLDSKGALGYLLEAKRKVKK
jgi:hypothetical protein